MGEARRRTAVRPSDDIDTSGILIDGWATLPGLAVDAREVAASSTWIDPDRVAHMLALHPPGSAGKVTLMRVHLTKGTGWRWKSIAVAPEDLATCPDLQRATHASVNRFHGLRRTDGLRQVQAVMADVDYHTTEGHKHRSPEEMMWILRARLAEAGYPEPSYWLHSGRGILLVWLMSELPAGAARRVGAIQRALLGPKQSDAGMVVTMGRRREPDEREARCMARAASVWQGTGVDRSAKDVARVFRICGSVNEKSEQRVRLLSPASWSEVRRYHVDELADAVLPYTRDEIAAFRADRQARYQAVLQARQDRDERRAEYGEPGTVPARVPNAGHGRHRFARAGGGQGQGRRRLDALMAIRETKWGGVPHVGYRDKWAFYVACAWANMEKDGDLSAWARELAPLCGLPEGELRLSLKTVHGKLQGFRRGETVTVDGADEPRDPRYTPSHAKILDALDVSAEEAEAAGLGFMLGKGGVSTPARRAAERRLREGAEARVTTVEKRHADGIAAHAMRAAGRTMSEISAALGRGLTSLTRAMAETVDRIGQAVEAAAEVVAEVVAPRTSLATASIHGSSRNLVAEPSDTERVLPRRSDIRFPQPSRHVEARKPMPDAPDLPPTRRFVPVLRPRPVPVSWTPSVPVVSSTGPVTSAPSRSPPSAEPGRTSSGQSLADMIREAFGPRVTIVAERSVDRAA